MKGIIQAICIAILLGGQVAGAVTIKDKDVDEDIKEFVSLLYGERKLTIADYRRYYGSGNEDELLIALYLCELQGWMPSYEDAKCGTYLVSRERRADKIESLYLVWLRTKLPARGTLNIVSVENVRGEGRIPHDVIIATLDGHGVTLVRNVGSRGLQLQFGELWINNIDNVNVHQLLEEDMKKREAYFKSLIERVMVFP